MPGRLGLATVNFEVSRYRRLARGSTDCFRRRVARHRRHVQAGDGRYHLKKIAEFPHQDLSHHLMANPVDIAHLTNVTGE
jgi:hypothetical protein